MKTPMLDKAMRECTKSREAKKRLEYLRGELRRECISYAELHELQSLVDYIDPGDVELLEAAGVPEHPSKADSGPNFDQDIN